MRTPRFYYGPDDYFDGDWPDETRIDGVQAILQYDPAKGWFVASHGDWYIRKSDGLWHAADDRGLLTELQRRQLIKTAIGAQHLVKVGFEWWEVDRFGLFQWLEKLQGAWIVYGETIANDVFHETFQRALAEADKRRRKGT